jgi:hypothetical protein
MIMYWVPEFIRSLLSVTVTLISGNLPVTLAVVDEVNILSENNGSGAHFVLCLETSRTVD